MNNHLIESIMAGEKEEVLLGLAESFGRKESVTTLHEYLLRHENIEKKDPKTVTVILSAKNRAGIVYAAIMAEDDVPPLVSAIFNRANDTVIHHLTNVIEKIDTRNASLTFSAQATLLTYASLQKEHLKDPNFRAFFNYALARVSAPKSQVQGPKPPTLLMRKLA